MSFDEAIRTIINKPDEFRKVWASKPEVRRLKGLHNETLLHFLAVEDEPASVRLLCELGADINATNNYGDTALHDCVALGNAKMTSLLLSMGANPNKPNAHGNTALHAAFENQVGDKIFKMLMETGGDLSLKNKFGQTPEAVC